MDLKPEFHMGIFDPATANLAQNIYMSKKLQGQQQPPSGQAGMSPPNTTPLGGHPGGTPK